MMEVIVDMKNYVRSRQRKGKTASEIRDDLIKHGYDRFAADALVMMHFKRADDPAGSR
jgi:SOS response regulatory protein OraA/RecX